MDTVWKPHVTVAAVLERDGRFLLVEEQTEDGILLNQPAGHLEPDESIVAGAVRETLEESAYGFEPDALVGVYAGHTRSATSSTCGSPSPVRSSATIRTFGSTPESCAPCG